MVGCQSGKMDTNQLTNVTVVRNTEGQGAIVQREGLATEGTTYSQPSQRQSQVSRQRPLNYIIVASYPMADRQRADKLVRGLRDKGYPAETLEAKGRIRVSIESTTDPDEAREKRDYYRKETDRQDIWILTFGE